MTRLLAGLVLAFFVSAASAQITLADQEAKALVQEQVNDAWGYACLLQNVDCRTIPKPVVLFIHFETEPSLQGRYYWGTGMVQIAIRFYATPYSMVSMTHEMVHYLQYIKKGRPLDHAARCAYEQEAFEADARVARFLGLENHPAAFTWEEVIGAYGCRPGQPGEGEP